MTNSLHVALREHLVRQTVEGFGLDADDRGVMRDLVRRTDRIALLAIQNAERRALAWARKTYE